MPGGRRPYKLEFADGEPLALWIFLILALANWFLSVALDMGAPYWFARSTPTTPRSETLIEENIRYAAPHAICWYANSFVTMECFLIALLIVTLYIVRKRIRFVYVGQK